MVMFMPMNGRKRRRAIDELTTNGRNVFEMTKLFLLVKQNRNVDDCERMVQNLNLQSNNVNSSWMFITEGVKRRLLEFCANDS